MPPPGMAENTQEIKVVVKGDASGAVGAFGRVKAAVGGVVDRLDSIKNAVGKVMGALGVFGLAAQGVQALVEAYKKLDEWMHRAARAAAEMRITSAFKDATEAMDRLISRQTLYNKLLKDELADLGRRKELRQIEESGKEQREKDRRDLARAKEIAGATDENEERAIRQRWAVEDETLERGKRYRQLRANVAEEEEKSAIYGSKARVTEENVAGVGADIDRLAAEKIRMNDEQRKEADKQIAALEAKRKALTEEAKQYRVEEEMAEKRAELYRRQIEDVRKSGGVAQVRNEVENLKINRQRQEDDRKFRAEVAKEDERRSQKLELEGMTDYQKYAELGNREYGAANRRRQAEERYAAETAKPTEERDEKRVAELREAVKTAQREEFEAADQKSAVGERIDGQTRNRGAEILGEAAGVQGNRLTAMGLGGGIDRENPKIESMMKDIISVLNNQLRATERLGDADHSAAFTE